MVFFVQEGNSELEPSLLAETSLMAVAVSFKRWREELEYEV